MPFRRVGARYLELHIVTPGGCEAIEVFRVGVRPWRLELPEAGAFECSDERLNKLHKYALHTLELCMHDHYEDCPWREQALYTYDSRLQMLYGYYNWGNYQFAAASLELFVPGQWENGHFNLCAPARSRRQIPVYTLVWLEQLYEYYLFSGDKTLFERCRGAAEKIVKLIYSQLDENAGLLREDSGERYWNFYEWREHLEGRGELSGKGFSALYNAYAVAALIAYSILSGDDEARNFAGKLRENMRRIFYQPRSGLFGSFYVDGKVLDIYNDHTQALMVLYGDLEPGLAAGLGARLAQGDCGTPASLSSLYLIIKAMCKSGVDSTLIYDRILQYYQLMLDNPSGTLWETGLGDYDFGYAGSLCHGWSALPTGFAKNCLLGIEPLEPGFASTSIHVRDCGLDFAAGAVPTPHGEITVEWRRTENGVLTVSVRAPKAIKLCIDNVCPVNVEQY